MSELLAKKYIEKSGNAEQWSPLRSCSILAQASGWTTEKYFGKCYKNRTPYHSFLNTVDNVATQYINLTKPKELMAEVFNDFWTNPGSLKQKVERMESLGKMANSFYYSITDEYITQNSIDIAVREVSKLIDAVWMLNAEGFYTTYLDHDLMFHLVNKKDSGVKQTDFDRVWEKASTPFQESFETRRTMEILEYLSEGKSLASVAEKLLYNGTSYSYVPTNLEILEALTAKFGSFNSKSAKAELARIRGGLERACKERNKWRDGLDNEQKHIAEFVEEAIYRRDWRKDFLMKGVVGLFKVARYLLRQIELEEKLASNVRLDELLRGAEYLQSIRENIKRREKGYSVFLDYNGAIEDQYGLYQENNDALDDFYLKNAGVKDHDALTGQVSSNGYAKGRAVIVLDVKKDGHALKRGDILVTGMTRPEYVPLMHKAAAIVTNEGGVTCHAAVVSREFGIPCVIGTKIATYVIKTGDTIEVDAEKGVVKITKERNAI